MIHSKKRLTELGLSVLQLALSSDKISSLNTPLLSLSLDVRENGALRPVAVEMNKEELSALISSLEAANKVNSLKTAHCCTAES